MAEPSSSSAVELLHFDLADHPHRRKNLLTDEWVLVSPHRARRPWLGSLAVPPLRSSVRHDPDCHLCPANERASGVRNPAYAGPFVFDNDFAALMPATPDADGGDPLMVAAPARGVARVICYSAHHSRTLPEFAPDEVLALVDSWCAQSAELGARWRHVAIFENKGEMMGCSNPHPHGQVWASDFVPTEVAREDDCQHGWYASRGQVLLDRVAAREIEAVARVVDRSDAWLAVVPWWAAWPFEILLIARSDARRLEDLDPDARTELAAILHRITVRYDNLFNTSFPYSMGWHGAPHGARDVAHWRLHAHFYPPLLRSASVRKFMVGFEMLAEAQRDITPEHAAELLRKASAELCP